MDRITTVTADVVVTRATREDVADIATLRRDEQGTPVCTLQLTFVPAGSAFAAGNRVLMRPSSITAQASPPPWLVTDRCTVTEPCRAAAALSPVPAPCSAMLFRISARTSSSRPSASESTRPSKRARRSISAWRTSVSEASITRWNSGGAPLCPAAPTGPPRRGPAGGTGDRPIRPARPAAGFRRCGPAAASPRAPSRGS